MSDRTSQMSDRTGQRQSSASEAESRTAGSMFRARMKSDSITWDDLLPYVTQRLERRKAQLDASPPTVCRATRVGFSEGRLETQGELEFRPEQDSAIGGGTDSQHASVLKPVTEQMKRLAVETRECSNSHARPPRGPKRTVPRLAVVGSGLAHLLLILALAMVGLAQPEKLAGLSFQTASAEAESEPLEVTQAVELAAPEESTSAPSSENAIDFSEQLTPAQPVSNVLGATPSVSQRLASANAGTSGKSSLRLADAASFYGASAGGNNFCYVIDASGSMRGGPWEAARRELLKSLGSLSPRQRFYIVLYTRDIIAIPLPGQQDAAPHHLYATAENLEHAARWLLSLRIGGSGASPKEALEFAITKEPDAIYLLTDGVTRVKDVAKYVRKRNRVHDLIHGEQIRTPIHTIAFYTLQGQQLLRQLASENGGRFVYVPDPEASR